MRAPSTITELFESRVALSGDTVAFDAYDASAGVVRDPVTWRAWYEQSTDVATALVAAGDDPGTSLGILAQNRAIWPIAELAGALAGMVTVGVYPTSSVAQVRAMIEDASIVTLVVDSAEQLAKVREATADLQRPLLVVADVAPALLSEDATAVHEESWEHLASAGRDLRLAESVAAAEVRRRATTASADDIAMLIYTSGSLGEPRGARISHRYVIESARSIRDTLGLTADDSSLSFLPFCHAGERIFGLYTRMLCGMRATLVDDPSAIWEAQVAAAPTLFGGMPRFFEKAYEALLAARADAMPGVAARWDRAIVVGRERAERRQRGLPADPALDAAWCDDQVVIRPVLTRLFGANVRLATSGGATLPLEVATYLDACGLTVLGAYGQTEHLCAAFNRPRRYRHDTVGPPMPGTTIRIADDGEVQLQRSALTFSGYHRREGESLAAFTADGEWLRTGDLGSLDADGFLRITGRIKELIALSNGKKVAPLPLEARLTSGDYIAHAVVHGEGHPYLVALFALRWSMVQRWQRQHGIDATREELATLPALVREIEAEVSRANEAVSRPEQVRRFRILPHDLTVESGELTATLKVRRGIVIERYRALLDAMYEESK